MWIFLNNAMLSIVDPKGTYEGGQGTKGGPLLVRARIAGDIEAVFPGAKVAKTPGRDYLFRATVSRREVAEAMFNAVADIDYTNFKGSVPEKGRHDAYMGVWGVMNREQERRQKPVAKGRQRALDLGPREAPAFDEDYDWSAGRFNRASLGGKG